MNVKATFFPKMPGEVFDLWIEPIIDHSGWPFASINDSFPSAMWRDHFLGLDLSVWSMCDWTRRDYSLASVVFHPNTMQLVLAISGIHLGDALQKAIAKAAVQSISNTAERISKAKQFAEEYRRCPGVLVGVQSDDRLRLVDGHHRIAGAYRASNPTEIAFACWLAEIPDASFGDL